MVTGGMFWDHMGIRVGRLLVWNGCSGVGNLVSLTWQVNQFAQNNRSAWAHPRFGSEHALDHWLLGGRHTWHLTQCKAFHEPPGSHDG